MRLAKAILTAICAAMALVAGFFAAVIALIGIAVFMLPRLFSRRGDLRPPMSPARHSRWLRRAGAIDVAATEVSSSKIEPADSPR